MSSQVIRARSFSVRQLRTLILVSLLAGVAVFTAIMFTSVQSLSERFGPEVAADLEWRALRGAQELAKTADLGLAMSDNAMVRESFGAYAASSDVQAIVAVDGNDAVVAEHGYVDSIAPVFAAPAGVLVHGRGYVASWAPAAIEGKQVGKVAMVVSTRRLDGAQTVLSRVSNTTLVAGVAGALLGALVILFFTRAVSVRDHQLNDYAHNLERKVEARTQELDERNRGMRLVLDNVAQGFITVDLAGVVASERSSIVDRWFGEPWPGAALGAFLAPSDPELASWFALGLEAVRDGFLPLELCLEQMPRRLAADGRTFDITYSPILFDARLERILVIVSDVTEHIIRQRSEREQREIVTLFQRITADRAGFDEFMEESAGLVASLAVPGAPLVERRTVHTLKGNCAIYGFDSYAELCNAVEDELVADAPLDDAQRTALGDAWRTLSHRVAVLLGDSRRSVVEVEFADLARVVEKARQGTPSRELAVVLSAWSHEPVARRFERLARYAASLARRLGKGDVDIAIADDGVRLDTARWAAFWGALVHAVRNAVDHGLEAPEARVAAGKPVRPKLAFAAARTAGQLAISVSDDGGGIDWDAVRERARASGLPAGSQADLEAAVFADGFSTRAEPGATSGRGVGLAALRAAVTALGGTIAVETTRGHGTTLRCRFADAEAQALPLRQPTQPLRRFVEPLA